MPNKFNREIQRKKSEARKGLSAEQITDLDASESLDERIKNKAKMLHSEMFPEEYDFYYDSISDANDRNRGINPMSQEYIEKVDRKRQKLGVSSLTNNGMPNSNDTLQLCLERAKEMFNYPDSSKIESLILADPHRKISPT